MGNFKQCEVKAPYIQYNTTQATIIEAGRLTQVDTWKWEENILSNAVMSGMYVLGNGPYCQNLEGMRGADDPRKLKTLKCQVDLLKWFEQNRICPPEQDASRVQTASEVCQCKSKESKSYTMNTVYSTQMCVSVVLSIFIRVFYFTTVWLIKTVQWNNNMEYSKV